MQISILLLSFWLACQVLVEPHPGITGVAPYVTPEWGDISRLTSGRIHPRGQHVAFCCRGEQRRYCGMVFGVLRKHKN
jgi:hypothetical protein